MTNPLYWETPLGNYLVPQRRLSDGASRYWQPAGPYRDDDRRAMRRAFELFTYEEGADAVWLVRNAPDPDYALLHTMHAVEDPATSARYAEPIDPDDPPWEHA